MRSRRGGGRPSDAADQLNEEPPRIVVRRFDNAIVLNVNGRPVYLSRSEAFRLSRALSACAVDIRLYTDPEASRFGEFKMGEK